MACADSNIAIDLLHNEFQRQGLKSIRIGAQSDIENYNELYSGSIKSRNYNALKKKIENS